MKRVLLIAVTSTFFATVGGAQAPDPTSWQSKLQVHSSRTFGPSALIRSAARAGLSQQMDSPTEWGQGALGYSKRFGNSLARSGVRNSIAFGLDTALHQDPRYYRSTETGVWSRVKHALRGTVLTRTDAGNETLSTWRLGSAYGGAYISNQWQPDRLNTVGQVFTGGSTTMGIDLVSNLTSEFWPDVKQKLFHRK